jgi:hypothetical protein
MREYGSRMRRYQSLGLGFFSALFCASMIAACSASGNDPTVPTGPGASDSGAAGDTSYNYGDSGSNLPNEDSSVSTPYDSGPTTPYDAGPPPPPSNDCDLSGSGAIGYITDLGAGSLPPCGTDDACGTGMCCLNLSGAIPASFLALLGGGSLPAGGCVAQ